MNCTVQVRSSCKACHATRPHSHECARLLQDVPSAFATSTIVLSGLSTLTDYDVHVVAQDNSVPANAQASPVMLTFATSNEVDATAPVWQGVPVVEASDHSTLSITAMLDEPGTVFYAVRAVCGLPDSSVHGLNMSRHRSCRMELHRQVWRRSSKGQSTRHFWQHHSRTF